jgi:GNAT superfamily N-acetyltransferase
MQFRFAQSEDAELLATLNAQLIRDEGHRNKMTPAQLTERMSGWLAGEYQAVIFEVSETILGYALFRSEPEYVYLRHLFVCPKFRRQGVGRQALAWLWENAWSEAKRLRIDVLWGNTVGQEFWRSVGFNEYCVTMEMTHPEH